MRRRVGRRARRARRARGNDTRAEHGAADREHAVRGGDGAHRGVRAELARARDGDAVGERAIERDEREARTDDETVDSARGCGEEIGEREGERARGGWGEGDGGGGARGERGERGDDDDGREGRQDGDEGGVEIGFGAD